MSSQFKIQLNKIHLKEIAELNMLMSQDIPVILKFFSENMWTKI